MEMMERLEEEKVSQFANVYEQEERVKNEIKKELEDYCMRVQNIDFLNAIEDYLLISGVKDDAEHRACIKYQTNERSDVYLFIVRCFCMVEKLWTKGMADGCSMCISHIFQTTS
jgi:hypothetical protein